VVVVSVHIPRPDQRLLEARVSTRSARVNRVCGFLDSDGIDYCGHKPGHAGGHYSYDPAGIIRSRRPCLVCRKPTTAHLCVCRACGGAARLGTNLDPLIPPPTPAVLRTAQESPMPRKRSQYDHKPPSAEQRATVTALALSVVPAETPLPIAVRVLSSVIGAHPGDVAGVVNGRRGISAARALAWVAAVAEILAVPFVAVDATAAAK
jgi:hypothetical protein